MKQARLIVGLICMLLMFCSGAVGQLVTIDKLTVRSAAPPPVTARLVRYTLNGTRGSRILYYWIVANYPRGRAIVSNPVAVLGVPDPLTAENNVTFTWPEVPGATSYDVLRTDYTRLVPDEDCNCAAAVDLNTTTFTHTSDTLSSYIPNAVPAAVGTITLDNKNYEQPTWVFDPLLANGGGGGVSSVFGRAPVVTAQAGDYAASQISLVPSGNVTQTNVQSAVAQLDTLKAPAVHTHAATDVVSGTVPLARGGTNNNTWVASKCVQVSSDGTKLESAADACGTGGGSPTSGSWTESFTSSTTWTLPGATHGLGTCNLGYAISLDDSGLRKLTRGASSITCEPDAGADQFDVVVTWSTATAGYLTVIAGGGTGGGGGGGSTPGGLTGTLQYNAGSGTFGGVTGSSVAGDILTVPKFVVTTQFNLPHGTSFPTTCSIGDPFFKSDAPAGRNMYAATNTGPCVFTLQGDGNSGGGGGSFDEAGTYNMDGLNIINAQVRTTFLGNNTSTGTTLNQLVCIGSDGLAIRCTTATAVRTIGTCYANCGTSASARVATGGIFSCDFDGSVTAGNWVSPSATDNGKCHDAGSSRPTTAIGILTETGVGASVYAVFKGVL